MISLEKKGYEYQEFGNPEFGAIDVFLKENQSIMVEAGAMMTMDTHISMKSQSRGGLGRFLTGESIFITQYTAEKKAGKIGIAPNTPGSIQHVYLENDEIFLQSTAFVASSPQIKCNAKFQGIKGFFSGESLFFMQCQGEGDLWFGSYGGIIEMNVDGEYIVDTGHVVAFTNGVEYSIDKIGGYKSFFFSKEGFVMRFKGKGKVWIQTRKTPALAALLAPFRPQKS